MRTKSYVSTYILLISFIAAGCQSSQSLEVKSLSAFEQEIIRDLDSPDSSKRTEAAFRVAFYEIGAGAPLLTEMLARDRAYPCGQDPMNHPVNCSEADAAASALFMLGAKAVDPLILASHHSRAGVRERAVQLLAGIEDPRANDAMLEALHDRDANVRLAAMAWRSPVTEHMVLSRTKLLLHDPDERVRAEAAYQLEDFASDPRVVNAFRIASKDSSSEVRGAVAKAK